MSLLKFLKELELRIDEYLHILPDNDGEEVYASYRGLAEDQLTKFVEWLRAEEGLRARGQ